MLSKSEDAKHIQEMANVIVLLKIHSMSNVVLFLFMRICSTSWTESHTNHVRSVVLSYELRQEVTDDVISEIGYKFELKTFREHFLTSSVSAHIMECSVNHVILWSVLWCITWWDARIHNKQRGDNKDWAHLSCPFEHRVPVVLSNNP
jgi:hypothetical protein